MKSRTFILLLVIILCFTITVPAFADSNPPAWGKDADMGPWASNNKILMGYYMTGFSGAASKNPWVGPARVGYWQGNCPACAP